MTGGHRSHPDPAQGASSDGVSSRLLARIESQDGHEECTLFPAHASADELVTTWVTAADDAFVDLQTIRRSDSARTAASTRRSTCGRSGPLRESLPWHPLDGRGVRPCLRRPGHVRRARRVADRDDVFSPNCSSCVASSSTSAARVDRESGLLLQLPRRTHAGSSSTSR